MKGGDVMLDQIMFYHYCSAVDRWVRIEIGTRLFWILDVNSGKIVSCRFTFHLN